LNPKSRIAKRFKENFRRASENTILAKTSVLVGLIHKTNASTYLRYSDGNSISLI